MNLYQAFKTNKEFERKGIEIEYGKNTKGEDIVFKIARAGGSNNAFNKGMERATKPYRRQIQNGTLDNSVADSIYMGVFIDTVLLGWEGVEDEHGNALAYNKENAKKVFTDLPDLFADLKEQSVNMSLFRNEEQEADLGNFGTSSTTD